jgi:hypothetical protein
LFYKLIGVNKSTKNDGRNAGQGLATRTCALAPPRVTFRSSGGQGMGGLATFRWSHSLPNTYWKMLASMLKIRSASREATQLIFQVEKMEEKKPIRLTETVQSAG